MNLILINGEELQDNGCVSLRDRRARHIQDVLRSKPGDRLQVGQLNGAIGTAEVLQVEPDVTLRCQLEATPPRPTDVLLLAVPRPQVLQRCLAHATAMGFGHIVLLRTWRVDKSHVLAGVVQQPELRHPHLLMGLEQSRRTHVPKVTVAPLFKPFVEDDLGGLLPQATQRFVAHPDATVATDVAKLQLDKTPIALALGPEGGFIPYEIEALQQQGFQAVQAGDHPLRVETALAWVHGQLSLLRRLNP